MLATRGSGCYSLGVIGVAARADDFHGFQRLPIQDDEMGRPVAANDGQFVGKIALIPFVLTDLTERAS